jgi:hypothetical protein
VAEPRGGARAAAGWQFSFSLIQFNVVMASSDRVATTATGL